MMERVGRGYGLGFVSHDYGFEREFGLFVVGYVKRDATNQEMEDHPPKNRSQCCGIVLNSETERRFHQN